MFVAKVFARRRFFAQICANSGARAPFGAYLRDEAISNKILGYEHWNYPKATRDAGPETTHSVASPARSRVGPAS